MSWAYLFLAGLFEIGWPVGIKISQATETRWLGIAIALSFMALSGYFLWLAQQNIPIGTAYAIWTGIGGAGTFIVGVVFFGDALSVMRILGVNADHSRCCCPQVFKLADHGPDGWTLLVRNDRLQKCFTNRKGNTRKVA